MKEAGSSDVARENIMYRRPNDKNSNCLQSLTRQLWQEQESKMHCKSKEENLYCLQSLTRQPQSAGERIQHYRPDH
jgi:hypothetical protein